MVAIRSKAEKKKKKKKKHKPAISEIIRLKKNQNVRSETILFLRYNIHLWDYQSKCSCMKKTQAFICDGALTCKIGAFSPQMEQTYRCLQSSMLWQWEV